MLNHIVAMGRLTRDPELRTTMNGVSVASFTVAVDRDYSGQGQEKKTDFIDCTAWRQTAEFISKYFHKGSMIVVSGRLESNKWTDREGNNRVSWSINADNVYFGESKKDSDSGSTQSGGGYYAQQGQYQGGARTASYPPDVSPSHYEELEDDGELPF